MNFASYEMHIMGSTFKGTDIENYNKCIKREIKQKPYIPCKKWNLYFVSDTYALCRIYLLSTQMRFLNSNEVFIFKCGRKERAGRR